VPPRGVRRYVPPHGELRPDTPIEKQYRKAKSAAVAELLSRPDECECSLLDDLLSKWTRHVMPLTAVPGGICKFRADNDRRRVLEDNR
jgi:hypothetical protein